MSDSDQIDELIDRYQDLVAEGQVPDLNELCKDHPNLRSEIEHQIVRINRMRNLLDNPLGPSPPEPDVSLSDDKTWVNQAHREAVIVEIPAPDGYEVIAPLGEGGMGIVYMARQIGLNRLVALKMILAGTRARDVDLSRFRDEARAIAALRHPNIVQIFEIGEFRGQPFFSLEYCSGGTLSKAIKGEPQSPTDAARMVQVLARAIHYAHLRGIIHRDLKPSNILLSSEYAGPDTESSTIESFAPTSDPSFSAVPLHAGLKITDFGLAKRVNDDSSRTQDGNVLGTPSYMAPEQAMGATKLIGPATDVYALGAILYELLTGRPPFKGASVHETLEQVCQREPVPVCELQPTVPVDLDTICQKCLQKDAKKRYLSAEALAEDLDRFLSGRHIHARPVSNAARIWRWCRREPRLAGLGGSTLALMTVLAVVIGWYGAQLGTTEARLKDQQRIAEEASKAARAAQESEDAQRHFAAMSEAARIQSAARPGWTDESRKQLKIAASIDTAMRDPVEIRSGLAAAIAGVDLRPVDTLARGLAAGALAYLPDGRVAIAPQLLIPFNPFLHVLIVDPRTKAEQRLPIPVNLPPSGKWSDASTAFAVSPDGRWLVLGLRGGKVFRWDLEANKPEQSLLDWKAHDNTVSGFAFSPDRSWLYTSSHDGRVRRWPLDAEGKMAAESSVRGNPPARLIGVAYWHAGIPAIYTHGTGGSQLLNPMSLAPITDKELAKSSWKVPALSSMSGHMAAQTSTGTIVTSDYGEASIAYWERRICLPVANFIDDDLPDNQRAHSWIIEDMAIHPSGMLVATVCPDEGKLKLWHLGTNERVVAVPMANARACAFSNDGRWLAVAGDHRTTIFEVHGMPAKSYLGRRGLPIRTIGLTIDDEVGTIAARQHPSPGNREHIVASIWSTFGELRDTVIHQSDVLVGNSRERIVASRDRTAFVLDDGKIRWPGKSASQPTVEELSKGGRIRDLAFDNVGRCWTIEDNCRLVRRSSPRDKPRDIAIGRFGAGRKDIISLRARSEYVAAGCDDGYLRVIRASDGVSIGSNACFNESEITILKESANTVHAVDVLGDETRVVGGTEDGRLWLFRLPDGERLQSWQAHDDRVTSVCFDTTGEWLASGGRDRQVHLWRRTGDQFRHYVTLRSPGARPVRQLLFTRDGRHLLVLHEKETAVRVWNTGQLMADFRAFGVDQ